jgi:hypothetical protein
MIRYPEDNVNTCCGIAQINFAKSVGYTIAGSIFMVHYFDTYWLLPWRSIEQVFRAAVIRI